MYVRRNHIINHKWPGNTSKRIEERMAKAIYLGSPKGEDRRDQKDKRETRYAS